MTRVKLFNLSAKPRRCFWLERLLVFEKITGLTEPLGEPISGEIGTSESNLFPYCKTVVTNTAAKWESNSPRRRGLFGSYRWAWMLASRLAERQEEYNPTDSSRWTTSWERHLVDDGR